MATSRMYGKKEQTESALLAAKQIKKATLDGAKGLSRIQAERVAAAAARNINGYGQKEEGPSRWQERKEAKRQMYLMSTEKAVQLGVRKDTKATTRDGRRASAKCLQIQCQRCFEGGHWTFECKNERVYVSRPSQTQKLQNPAASRQPLQLELCDPLPVTNTYLEVEIKKPKFKSSIFATMEESKGCRSNKRPPRKSGPRNRKRTRSKKSSSSDPSTEESPSRRDSESEDPPTSSEDMSSSTHSSSTMSSPSRTTSSSKKTSSFSSTDPPSPESESEERPGDLFMETHADPDSDIPANEPVIDQGDTQNERQSHFLTSLSICTFDMQQSELQKVESRQCGKFSEELGWSPPK